MGNKNIKKKQIDQLSNNLKSDRVNFSVPMLDFSTIQQNQLGKRPINEQIKIIGKQGSQKLSNSHQNAQDQLIITNQVPINLPKQRFSQRAQNLNKLQTILKDQLQQFTSSQQSKHPTQVNQREIAQEIKKLDYTHPSSVLLGLWVGVSASIIIFLIAIIIIHDLSINDASTFSRDFPTWRGIAFFIFYIWVLGFNFAVFQKNKIRFRQILECKRNHYPTSLSLFKIAAFHSSVFMIMFLLYVLEITGTYDLPGVTAQYFALASWGVMALFLFMPLPILFPKGRFYAFRLLGNALISPFKGVSFPQAWIIDQLVSMPIPLKDLQYTICYYSQINFEEAYNVCQDSNRVSVVLIVAVFASLIKILQCIRQGYDKGKYFMTPFFFNSIKFFFTAATAVLAFVYKLGSSKIQAAWILFAIITTFFSYAWDIKIDWDLLQKNSQNPFLRQILIFRPIGLYYFVMSINLMLRFLWVMTISPSFTSFIGDPSLVALILGAIQIFRRGIWNLLRIEKEHINLPQFKEQGQNLKEIQLEKRLAKVQNTINLQIKVVKFFQKFEKKRQKFKKQLLKLSEQNQSREQFLQRYQDKLERQDQIFSQRQVKQIENIMEQTFKANQSLKNKLQQETNRKKRLIQNKNKFSPNFIKHSHR